MIVAVPAIDRSIDSRTSPVFGRAPFFIIARVEDNDIKEWHPVDNPGVDQRGGAGIVAARTLRDNRVTHLVASSIGPKAWDALSATGIRVYRARNTTVRENIEMLARGELEEIRAPGRGRRGPGGWRGRGPGPGGRRGPW